MNKQIRFSAESLSPLFKTSVGFDNLVNEFFNEPQFANATGYPPYNISKTEDDIYEITLAVAGFKESDINIELKDGILKVKGEVEPAEREYAYKGISSRKFEKSFRLSEFVVIDGADLKDGILVVYARVELPEEKRPRKIELGSAGASKKKEYLKG